MDGFKQVGYCTVYEVLRSALHRETWVSGGGRMQPQRAASPRLLTCECCTVICEPPYDQDQNEGTRTPRANEDGDIPAARWVGVLTDKPTYSPARAEARPL